MRYYTTAKISENIHETPEGYLVCVGVPIARIGEMVYVDGETPLESDEDGRVLIEREEEEVFRPETMASFEGKPVTIGHPADAVTPGSWDSLAVGIIQNVRRGEGENETDLLADLLITVRRAIEMVKNGLREVSCGYDAEYTQADPGKGFQTKIVGNHLALVKEGRAGSAYAINDSKGTISVKTFAERMKDIVTKAQEDLGKLVKDAAPDKEKADKEKADKDKKDKDGKTGKDGKATKDDEASLSDVIAMIKALAEKVDGLNKPTSDEETDDETEETKDDDSEETPGNTDETDIGGRLDKLEQAVAKLLEAKDNEDETDVSGEADEFNDEKSGGSGSEDDMPKSTLTGDTASLIEILAPGKKFTGKDAKTKALKVAYSTADGKRVIDTLTGKKKLTTDNAAAVGILFRSAAELLKEARADIFAQARRGSTQDEAADKGPMTPEKINQMNAEYYNKK